jgi:hypothetical protein
MSKLDDRSKIALGVCVLLGGIYISVTVFLYMRLWNHNPVRRNHTLRVYSRWDIPKSIFWGVICGVAALLWPISMPILFASCSSLRLGIPSTPLTTQYMQDHSRVWIGNHPRPGGPRETWAPGRLWQKISQWWKNKRQPVLPVHNKHMTPQLPKVPPPAARSSAVRDRSSNK